MEFSGYTGLGMMSNGLTLEEYSVNMQEHLRLVLSNLRNNLTQGAFGDERNKNRKLPFSTFTMV